MKEKTDQEKRSDEILQKLLDSYPCKDCDKFKKYQREISSLWKNSGGYKSSYSEEIQQRMHSKFIKHVEKKHLPSKEDWELLNKK